MSIRRLIVFEGVDGSGKSTFAKALSNYYRRFEPRIVVHSDSFPGSLPGTLGEWVYRVHHGLLEHGQQFDRIAPPALQLLHVAAHVDAILNRISPILSEGGLVILDRYWWSTYAYSRINLIPELVWPMIDAERIFWRRLPSPTVIYLCRQASLKGKEISPTTHAQLDSYYREVMKVEREAGTEVFEIENDNEPEATWENLLSILDLPHHTLNEI